MKTRQERMNRVCRLATIIIAMVWLLFLVSCSPPTGGSAPTQPTAAPAATEAPSSVEPTAAPTQLPAVPEARRLTLEWPPDIKVGDSDVLRLTLEIDPDGGVTATAVVEGHETRSEKVLIPNLYETHNVLAEARLDLAGVEVTPTGEISEPMLPGEPVTFFWSVKPEQVGTYRGTIWVHLRFIPKDGGPESRKTLSAQQVEVRAVNLLGLSGNAARWMGLLGTLVGSSLSFEKVSSWVISRLRKKKNPQPQV
jgi:hypothetical protein